MADNQEDKPVPPPDLQGAPEFTLVQVGKVPEGAIEDVAARVSDRVAERLSKTFVPRQEFAKVLANQRQNFKDHAEFRKVNVDLADRVNQMRRGFGFNGKLDDPDAEKLIAETWVEMRALAQMRREELVLEKARQVVREDLARRLTFISRIWKFSRWALLAIVSAALWQVGSMVGAAVHLYLHSRHLLGQ